MALYYAYPAYGADVAYGATISTLPVVPTLPMLPTIPILPACLCCLLHLLSDLLPSYSRTAGKAIFICCLICYYLSRFLVSRFPRFSPQNFFSFFSVDFVPFVHFSVFMLIRFPSSSFPSSLHMNWRHSHATRNCYEEIRRK